MKSLAGLGLILSVMMYAEGLLINAGRDQKDSGDVNTRKARATENFPQDQPQQSESMEGYSGDHSSGSELAEDKLEGGSSGQMQVPNNSPLNYFRYRVYPPLYWLDGKQGKTGGVPFMTGKDGLGRQYLLGGRETSEPSVLSLMRRVGKADSNFIRFGRSFPYIIGPASSKKNNFIRLGRENPRQTNFIRLGRSSIWKHSDRMLPTVGFFPDDLYYSSAGPHWTPSFELPTSSELRRSGPV